MFFTFSQRKIVILSLFTILMSFLTRDTTPNPSLTPYSLADLVAALLPAVVSISTIPIYRDRGETQAPLDIPLPKGHLLEEFLRELFERMQAEENIPRIGSGFIIDNKGHIVTNNHLIEGECQIIVTLNDNTELKATLIGRDFRTDIAVLKIKSSKKLSFIQWGEPEKLRVGDPVIAIGSPFGLGGSVTSGIVSYLARDIGRANNLIAEYIQTDAALNPGSAGGPLCDTKGKVVGINAGIYSLAGENLGIGFAIPSEAAKKVVVQILHYGRVKRGYLGINTQVITADIAESLGFQSLKGALVSGVIKNGPAATAHLQAGDIILKLDKEEIKDQRSFLRIEEDLPIGSQVSVSIFRKGKILSLPLQVAEATDSKAVSLKEAEKGLTRGTEIYGMILQELTEDARKQFGISCDIQGVLVFDVEPQSPAAEKGIRSGDMITEINQEEPISLQHAINLLKKAEKEHKNRILLLINRNGEPRYISVPVFTNKKS
jgi:serine protease Do